MLDGVNRVIDGVIDCVIAGGELIDGSGSPRRRADVAIDGGRIVAVGLLGKPAARQRIDASGLIVAPGFIDSHSHDDQLLLQHPLRHPKLLQGVTTVVTGNCGISLAPLLLPLEATPPQPLDILQGPFQYRNFADYIAAVEAAEPALNAALLVGHTTLRVGAMDDLSRPANAREAQAMRQALEEALQAGAVGLSTGVFYDPARAANCEELIAVGQPLAGGRGVIAMHIRDEGAYIDEALREAFAVARALGAPLILSHHKLLGVANHGGSIRTLAMIEQAAAHMPVCADCYPYSASSTVLLPDRVASSRDVLITWSAAEPAVAGRSLNELARERGIDAAALARQLVPGGAIYFAMSDEDVDRILSHPLTMIGSDGLPAAGLQHPRLWGSFPRVLGHYVRERRLLALELAVHKMTGLTASRFALADRGLLKVGYAADITVFDPAQVSDRASYTQPAAEPQGICFVFVNGELAVAQGEMRQARAGQVLKGRGWC